jgi:hypothetical protein
MSREVGYDLKGSMENNYKNNSYEVTVVHRINANIEEHQ